MTVHSLVACCMHVMHPSTRQWMTRGPSCLNDGEKSHDEFDYMVHN